MTKAIFLDKVGTVVQQVWRPNIAITTAPWNAKEVKFEANAQQIAELLKDMGYLLIMVSNQADIAYRNITREELKKMHRKIKRKLKLDDIFICAHPRESNCFFRKPNPGMLLAAAEKYGINLKESWLIGDKLSDMEAGLATGCKVVLIDKPYNNGAHRQYTVQSLYNAVQLIKRLTG